jgi:hypothetical protein
VRAMKLFAREVMPHFHGPQRHQGDRRPAEAV